MIRSLALENDLSFVRKWRVTMEGKKSKRGRVGEGRPTKRTPEVVARIAEAVAIGLTDEEAALLAGIDPDTMTEWRKHDSRKGQSSSTKARRQLEAYRGPSDGRRGM